MPAPKPTPKPAAAKPISKTDYNHDGLSLTPTPLDIRKHKVDIEQVKKALFSEKVLKQMRAN